MSRWKVTVAVIVFFVFSSAQIGAQEGPTDREKELVNSLIAKALSPFSSQGSRRAETEARVLVIAKNRGWSILGDFDCLYRARVSVEGYRFKIELLASETNDWKCSPLQRFIHDRLEANPAEIVRGLLSKYQVKPDCKEERAGRTLCQLLATTDPKDHIPKIELEIVAETGEIPYLITYNQHSESDPFRWEMQYALQLDGRLVIRKMKMTTLFHINVFLLNRPSVLLEIQINPFRFSD